MNKYCIMVVLKRNSAGPISVIHFIFSVILCVSRVEAGELDRYQEKPRASQALFTRGQTLYRKQCAVCHGLEGGADGKAAYLLYPKARDFSRDKFRLVSTATMEATDEDLFKTISRGMSGSAMPPWGHLSAEDRWALVYYVRYLSEYKMYVQSGEITEKMALKGVPWKLKQKMINKIIAPESMVSVPPLPAVTPESLKNGRELFVASCAGCHGAEGRGDGQQKMRDNLGYPLRPRDLTAGIFKGASDSQELYCRMVGGMPGSPMPSYSGVFTQEQIWDLIHFVQTLTNPEAEERARLKQEQIIVRKIPGEIDGNPLSSRWQDGPSTFVALTPLWWRDDRMEGVEVKAVHDGKNVAVYLTWPDATLNDDVVAVQSFSDGAAVQFSRDEDPPFFGMGDAERPVAIWHWKSGWEGVGEKRKDIETRYPDAAHDWYQSQSRYQRGSRIEPRDMATQFHDPQFITAWGAGNPVADPRETNTAEEGAAQGLGSYSTHRPGADNVRAQGIWKDGRWHVVFVRAMRPSEKKSLSLNPGDSVHVAFALWDGAHEDRNGQKVVSIWNTFIFEK